MIYVLLLVLPAVSCFYVAPFILTFCGQAVGWYLRRKSRDRRAQLLARVQIEEEELHRGKKEEANVEEDGWETIESHVTGWATNGGKAPRDWEGVVGFFHPFCNAGGGGERVLWAAIRATQKRWPKAVCVVYTGDRDVDKSAILKRVEQRFNIHLHSPTIIFLYLSTRYYVLSSTYPYVTLLGQSLGSLIVAYDAFSLLVPDIFIDTMGYAFTLAFSKFLFPAIPTGAYVHYPTISTDMLGSLGEGGQGLNAGTGRGWRGKAKRKYWHLFARIYSWVGGGVDVVMTNSSWTQAHIRSLWGPARAERSKPSDVEVVFPPVAVEELERAVDVSAESERKRERVILYIAQFRPEKNHTLILRSFAEFLNQSPDKQPTKLALIGSVRHSDDATRVYDLRLLAHELKIKENVSFICDASWPEILDWLRKSWIGVNGMWNEHFGIGIVEYQAAGLISVVHDSGGPKEDIVVEFDGGPTGFRATTAPEFAEAFRKVFALSADETLLMRRRARASAGRFTEEAFARRWTSQVEQLVALESSSGTGF
ncbi:asparagine-linked glycosylation protein [Trichoglossum hirsutum]|uniref:GDP-Man:Man(3)GlcNAc(2)-PP-Dol alpha-1,2-mannosyltransferase n=1 Tax=Trichoglossum hirsutum TaxID=265104 RepID=A0A9P8IJ70_9PEZI|nr:asparagine-linked glycosylation protein [Trichoglossum hirsutum]